MQLLQLQLLAIAGLAPRRACIGMPCAPTGMAGWRFPFLDESGMTARLPACPPARLPGIVGCSQQYIKDWLQRCQWGLLEIFSSMSVEEASAALFPCPPACMPARAPAWLPCLAALLGCPACPAPMRAPPQQSTASHPLLAPLSRRRAQLPAPFMTPPCLPSACHLPACLQLRELVEEQEEWPEIAQRILQVRKVVDGER